MAQVPGGPAQLDAAGQLQAVHHEQDNRQGQLVKPDSFLAFPVQENDQAGRGGQSGRMMTAPLRLAPGSRATSAITSVLTSAEKAVPALTW